MHEQGAIGAAFAANLTDSFEERQRFDVADGTADLDQGDVEAFGRGVDAAFDLVGDMRNDLHGRAEIVATALFTDHFFVNAAGGDRILAGQMGVDEALVVTQVEIGLGAVVGDVDLAVLERAHRARIDIDVGVELHHRYPQAAGFENGGEGGSGNAFAERRHHPTGHENEGSRGAWGVHGGSGSLERRSLARCGPAPRAASPNLLLSK